LEDPAPVAAFDGFGDNSLNFVLRCFLANFFFNDTATTEIYTAIDKAFREAGITIAYPQRDIHFDIGRPLQVNITSEKQATSITGDKQPA
jgi:potassium efflux system protein